MWAAGELCRVMGRNASGERCGEGPEGEARVREDGSGRLGEGGVDAVPVEFSVDEGLDRRYVDKLLSSVSTGFQGLSVVLDCGNGAASHLAPELFRRAGAEVRAICCGPDWRDSNLGC